MISICILLISLSMAVCQYACAQTRQASVIISGQVTDFNGNAMAGASVFWQNESFDDVCSATCDENGYYKISVPCGRHYCISAINMQEYPKSKELKVSSPDDMRLEFWGWNFIAEHDTTLNIRYHRMEAYGVNVFSIQGATPAYQIYVRPMSLTRTIEWTKNQTAEANLAPPADKLEVKVFIDGEEVDVLMKQAVKEYFCDTQTGTGFLISVNKPDVRPTRPYSTFRIVLADLENGDKGEAIYHYEHKDYMK